MDKYDEKAAELDARLRFRKVSDQDVIARALREAAAEAYEDAASMVQGGQTTAANTHPSAEDMRDAMLANAARLRAEAREPHGK